MIVIAIIGILMAYAILAYKDHTSRSRAGECLSMMNGAKIGVTERWNATNNLVGITSNATAFVSAAASIKGANVTSVTVIANGVIECLVGGSDVAISGKKVILTPTATATSSSITWARSTFGGFAEPHKPGGCT